MIITAHAKRYAKALYELAREKNCLDEMLTEFKSFLTLIEKDSDLNSLLNLPSAREREKILSTLLKDRFSELFFSFLLAVLKNRRFSLINQIYRDFQNRIDSYYNRIRAEAITALPLPDDKLIKLSRQIADFLNAEVRIENKVDPSIVGGIIIRLNGKMFNGSLLEQFKKLKQYLGDRTN